MEDLENKGPSIFYGRFGNLADRDLQRAILLWEEGAEKSAKLALVLLDRFHCLGELSDLDQSILKQREAIQLTSDCHPAKPGYLSKLSDSLLDRFQFVSELDDLEQSISMVKQALQLIADDHPEKPHYLSILGLSLLIRFQRSDELNDSEQPFPGNSVCLGDLPDALVTRFYSIDDPSTFDHAILQYSNVACAPSGSITERFHAAQQWIFHARALGHHSLLNAYSTAIGLLPQLAWIGFSLTNRYHELMRGTGMVREGATVALRLGHPQLAVEWLEQGRSVVWGELFQLRNSFEELSSAYPHHARQLQQLSLTAASEHAGAIHNKFLSSLSHQIQSHRSPRHLEQDPDRHRELAIKRDKLLQVIRGLPGFERFLLHKEFFQLRTAAHSGPVVILNAAETYCDTLIIHPDKENVIHVPLPDFTLKQSRDLQSTMDSLLGHVRVIPSHCDDRDGQRALRQRFNWESILSSLWKGVIKPVLDALDISVCLVVLLECVADSFLYGSAQTRTPGELSRIFWCPTGPFTFLPIHAAGLYGTHYSEPGHKVFDFVISSYIPALSILTPPIRDTASSGDLRVLAVSQSPSDGQTPLPGVHTELEYIRTVLRSSQSAQITLVEPFAGTVDEVLALLKDADWVHFACHGVQDSENPINSGLCLANERRLKLSDIIALSRPRGGLAFLSACQTAMGDKNLSDEAVHIAAGMLFAGYGGVIGTMWSISDRVAPAVAKDVYEQLFRTGAMPDYREAARALHNAVGRLRENNASFVEWLPFIHVSL